MTIQEKYNTLIEYICEFESAAVAFSSGVDSAFLLYAAKEALGESVLAITAKASAFPRRELSEAEEFCEKYGVKHEIFEFDVLSVSGFAENPKNRCYVCKKALFSGMIQRAKDMGFTIMLEGSNLDDEGDYRPGLQAVAELQVKSPLRELGFTKAEIRELSMEFGLPTWDKPSFACLASRFVYGEEITQEKLAMVEQAENILLEFGFKQFRVRIHGTMARIELLPDDFEKFMKKAIRESVHQSLMKLGFTYVTLDLQGYRTGSMNETIL